MSRASKGRIHKRMVNGKESKNYYLQYYVNGKQFLESLKTGDEKFAEKERDRILRPLQAKTKADKLREIKSALEAKENDADKFAHENKGAVKLDLIWDAISNHKEFRETRDSTMREYKLQWTAFVDEIKKNHPKVKTISDITSDMTTAYMRTKKERSRGTQNKIIRCCTRVFRLFYNTGDKRYNPFSGIDTFSETKIKQERHRPLTWDKAMELCDKAPNKEMKLLLFLGLFTGQRLGDCVLLSWSEVDLMRNLIMLTQRKTGQEITIPIHLNLRPLLEDIPKTKRKGYVLTDLADIYLNQHPSYVTKQIKTVFKNCGINPYKEGTGPGTDRRAVVQYSFHSLRHTFNTQLRENGIGDAVVQALTGHTSQAMTDRYTAIGGNVIQSAINALPALTGDKGNTDYQERQGLKKMIDSLPIEQVKKIKELLK